MWACGSGCGIHISVLCEYLLHQRSASIFHGTGFHEYHHLLMGPPQTQHPIAARGEEECEKIAFAMFGYKIVITVDSTSSS